MGYRIVYGDDQPKQEQKSGFSFRAMVATCLLLFALAVRLWWPEGRMVMERFLMPGEVNDMQTAVSAVITDIRNGKSFSEAVVTFCRENILDAQIDQ